MKIVVIGANGQLGSDVCRFLLDNGDDVVGLSHADIEVSSLDSVSRVLKEIQPRALVNTSAMHKVEDCERHPDQAFAVNGLGPKHLALVCNELGSVLIHISTDYVFDGAKGLPYVETDPTCPLNVYGRTKLAGEQLIHSVGGQYFIVRTSALYGKKPCRAKGGLNFVDLMLKLAAERNEIRVVDNEIVTPTSTEELARHIVSFTRFDCYGTYHATAEGSCSWYDFAREVFLLARIQTRLVAASPGEFPAKVPRPLYSVLENSGLNAHGMNFFTTWKDGLRQYLA